MKKIKTLKLQCHNCDPKAKNLITLPTYLPINEKGTIVCPTCTKGLNRRTTITYPEKHELKITNGKPREERV